MGFAEKLRANRLARCLTQKELAEAADVHHVEISRLENGRNNPTTTTLKKLSKALKLEPRDLAEPGELANAARRTRKKG